VDAKVPRHAVCLLRRTAVDSFGPGNPSEKRKVDSSILSLTTSSEPVSGDPLRSPGAKRGAKELRSLP
jgi:hypothetical protein